MADECTVPLLSSVALVTGYYFPGVWPGYGGLSCS